MEGKLYPYVEGDVVLHARYPQKGYLKVTEVFPKTSKLHVCIPDDLSFVDRVLISSSSLKFIKSGNREDAKTRKHMNINRIFRWYDRERFKNWKSE